VLFGLSFLVVLGFGSRLWSQADTQAQKQFAAGVLPTSIHGVVANKDGALYEGARVTLTAAGPGAAPARTLTTDSSGAFNFSGVAAGAFTLTISSNGFATQTVSGVLRAGEAYDAHTIVLPMTEATSEVRVTASQQDIAVEQFHEEEHQRVLGVIPNFFVAYAPDAPLLTTHEKFALAWKSSIDPVTFLAVGAFAGIEQAGNTYSGYGQGAEGYGKRFGAGYADSFIGTMLGGAILPSVFKQDPRYFYKGTGTVRERTRYALTRAVVCKGDNGHWQLNYSGILGSLAAGGISNAYYPASNRNGVELTFESTGLGIAGSAVGNLFQEFVVRKLTPKLPHYAQSNP
jgi:hypothetical protein